MTAHLRILRCFVLGLMAMPGIRLGASTPMTPLKGPECAQLTGVADDAFYYFEQSQPASVYGGEGAELQLIQRASLRALVVFRLCPAVGEATLSQRREFMSRWLSILVDELKGADGVYVRAAASELPCSPETPQLCNLRHSLEADPPSQPIRRNTSKSRSYSLAHKVTADAADEYTAATGAILAATDHLGFVLEVFPEQFLSYMSAHPDVLESWLGQAHETLFRGMPESRDSLAEYKRQLIDKTSRYTVKDARLLPTRDKVIQMLKSAPVSVID